jgi:hypothetical protein
MGNLEVLDAPAEGRTVSARALRDTQIGDSPQQRYQQEMQSIREKVESLPEGQDRVVMHQLWQLAHASYPPTPQDFPALARHGFIVEPLGDDRPGWLPYTAHLKDFAGIGISPSNAYGYSLYPSRDFAIRLQTTLIR